MQNNLNTFQFGSNAIRVVLREGEPWWIAADVCTVLDLNSTAVRRLDEDEKGLHSTQTPGGAQQLTVVSESGLYSLVLGSRKPEAKAFKKWITSEVLPSIRRTGSYVHDPVQALMAMTRPEMLEMALGMAREKAALQTQNATQAATIAALAPKAEFADRVSNSKDVVTFKELAMALGTGQNRFTAWLRSIRILQPFSTKPFQEYADAGYFKVDIRTTEDRNGQDRVYTKTLITGKGQQWLQKKWDARGGK